MGAALGAALGGLVGCWVLVTGAARAGSGFVASGLEEAGG